MAGKSMEQRAKAGPLLDRWKAAQSKNKVLDDRKFAELGKLLREYDDAVEEHRLGGDDGNDVMGEVNEKINVVMSGYLKTNKQLHDSLKQLEADFSKKLPGINAKGADGKFLKNAPNLYNMHFAKLADDRQSLFAKFEANDQAANDQMLELVAKFAEFARANANLQEDVVASCDKLANQIRSLLQNYKRQIADAKDKNAISALDDLADLL